MKIFEWKSFSSCPMSSVVHTLRYQEIKFESSKLCSDMCGFALSETTHMRTKSHGGEVARTGAA